MAKAIGTVGTISTLTIAGFVFTDITSNLIVLIGAGATVNQRSSLRKPGGGSGYSVTSGKTYTINAMRIMQAADLSAAVVGIKLSYGDNDCGQDTATAITNPVYYLGSSGAAANPTGVAGANGTQGSEDPTQFAPFFGVPATKYTNVELLTSSSRAFFQTFGYEA